MFDEFANAPVGTIQEELWATQISKSPKFIASREKRLEVVQKDSKAVLLLNPIGFSYWRQENRDQGCHLVTEKRNFREQLAVPTRPDFEYLATLNYHLSRFEETGIIERLVKEYLAPHDKEYYCSHILAEKDTSFNMEQAWVYFAIVATGILISITCGVLEVLGRKSLRNFSRA